MVFQGWEPGAPLWRPLHPPSALGQEVQLSYLAFFVPLAPHFPFLGLSVFTGEMGMRMPVLFIVILVSQKHTMLPDVPGEGAGDSR